MDNTLICFLKRPVSAQDQLSGIPEDGRHHEQVVQGHEDNEHARQEAEAEPRQHGAATDHEPLVAGQRRQVSRIEQAAPAKLRQAYHEMM
jgi:hypothetical protein